MLRARVSSSTTVEHWVSLTRDRVTWIVPAPLIGRSSFQAVLPQRRLVRQAPPRLPLSLALRAPIRSPLNRRGLTLKRAPVPFFRSCDPRSTYASRLRAGGVADAWVTPLLHQGDPQLFTKYSQMQ